MKIKKKIVSSSIFILFFRSFNFFSQIKNVKFEKKIYKNVKERLKVGEKKAFLIAN